MEDIHQPAREPATPSASRRARGRSTNRIFGWIYLGVAVAFVVLAIFTWAIGHLNLINVLVYAIAIFGMVANSLMALRGDYPGTRMDEGQRDTYRAAQADAFYVAYFGLFVLFVGNIFVPNLLAYAQAEVGTLLLLVVVTCLGGYMWRRWRP